MFQEPSMYSVTWRTVLEICLGVLHAVLHSGKINTVLQKYRKTRFLFPSCANKKCAWCHRESIFRIGQWCANPHDAAACFNTKWEKSLQILNHHTIPQSIGIRSL